MSNSHAPRLSRRRLALGLLSTCLLLIALLAPAAPAAPPLLRQFCEGEQSDPAVGLGGHCLVPRGVAVDQATGDAYVVDAGNRRIQKFTAWGQFLRAWGWDVVASGPGNKPAKNEIQEVSVDATGGSFALSFYNQAIDQSTSSPIAFDASAASVQAALEAPGKFQAGDLNVSGPAGGPWAIEFTGRVAAISTRPFEVVNSTLSGGAATATVLTVQDGGSFEVCVAADGDVCKSGQEASSAGGFSDDPRGIAVDSAGNVYVAEPPNRRVQKFSPDGEFLLMYGGDVNRTKVEAAAPEAQRNLCPVDPGDICQAGTGGTGNGQFSAVPGAIPGQFGQPQSPSAISSSPDGSTIYVGDVERIQKFDTGGHYSGQIALPEAGTVGALAADPKSGDLYFAYERKQITNQTAQPGVHRLNSVTGIEIGTPLDVKSPVALAADAAGSVYAFQQENHHNGAPPLFESEIFKFDSGGKLIERFGKDEFNTGSEFNFNNGMAASNACGIKGTDLFVSGRPGESGGVTLSFIRLYGPSPDPNLCPPPKLAPSIDDQYALSVDTDGATVRAKINPHFWPDTTYYVQYGTGKCSEGGCEETALAPGAQLSGGTVEADVTTSGVFLGASKPLTPDTTYHYRFIAKSSGGGPVVGKGGVPGVDGEEGTFHTFPAAVEANTACPNQVFRIAASAPLPDCRAYEMVSPLDKNNAEILTPQTAFGPEPSSLDGNAFSFIAGRAFGDSLAGPLLSQYIATRDPAAGWSTDSINAPRSSLNLLLYDYLSTRYQLFSDDLCSAWMSQDTLVPLAAGAPEGVPNLYRRDNCGAGEGEFELLTLVDPPGIEAEDDGTGPYWLGTQGASADSRVSLIRAPAPLTPDASTVNPLVYQLYAQEEGQLRLVSILPSGNAATGSSSLGTAEGNTTQFRESSDYRALSADGSRAFWTDSGHTGPVTAGNNTSGTGPGTLYLRVNLSEEQSALSPSKKCTEPEKACTYRVSGLVSGAPARFWSGSTDGTRAIFSIGEDLYEFSATEEEGELKTQASLIAHEMAGVMGASEDARRVYFVSGEVLSGAQKNSEGAEAKEGEPNLYLYEAGAGGGLASFNFIAGLSDLETKGYNGSSPIHQRPVERTSRVSADGLHAAFTATTRLTGYDNTDVQSGQPDVEVYLFDAGANGGQSELTCASCNPSGARPTGRQVGGGASGAVEIWAAAQIPSWMGHQYPGRQLSDDGERLFFESFEALVTRDTNGKQDVYQWEAPGSGDCTAQSQAFSPPNEGCISLISSGQSPADSSFLDATPSGSDAFFITESSLLPQDLGLIDVYDARVNGGFPPPPTPPPACEGEACQGPLSAPDDPTPASSSFEGAGNVREEGKARKSRCPKPKQKVKARKGKTRCAKPQHKRANHNRRAGR